MIRERRLASPAVTPGAVISTEVSKDAVFHQFQIELEGAVTALYPAGASAAVNTQFSEGFPFNLMSRVRLIRNGSDVVWQGSGKQLAKESLFLNGRYPAARIWVYNNGTTGTGTNAALLSVAAYGQTVYSNSQGIGGNTVPFVDTATTATKTSVTNFRCVAEMWLQLGVDDSYFSTLVDARPLASYVLEITWANLSDIIVPGSNNVGTATLALTGLNGTGSAACTLMSYDQDNLQLGVPFGTFKRASFQPPGLSYSSSQVQALLPRGNLYYGVILEALGLKAAGLATIAQPGNDIITQITNRINSNYYLRDVQWKDLQAKNLNDGVVPTTALDPINGVLGWAMMKYPCTGNTVKECIATYTMDQFDYLLSIGALAGADGNTYNGSPTINLLTQEVIPGKSVSQSGARGAFAGSISATSAKPGA
jgi:hypothetical protein